MWAYKYDEFVRRKCKDRNLKFPSKLTDAHQKMFGKSAPQNAGVLQHTLNRNNNKNNLMAAHQSFLNDRIHITSNHSIKLSTGYGIIGDDDSYTGYDDSDTGYDGSDSSESTNNTGYDYTSNDEAGLNFQEMQDMDELGEMEDIFNSLRASGGPTLPGYQPIPQFIDSDDEDKDDTAPPHRTRTARAPRFGDTNYSSNYFGRSFHLY